MTGNEFEDGIEDRVENEVRAMFAERSRDLPATTSPYRAVRQRIAVARRKRRQRIGGASAAFAVAAVGIGVWATASGGPDSAPRPGGGATTGATTAAARPAGPARFVYADGKTLLPAGPLHDAAEAYLKAHYPGGLSGGTVVTTFDHAMQNTAEQLKAANTIGLAALDPKTGYVKALRGPWDRPAGIADTFKPITLAAAFETGHYTPDSTEPGNTDKHPIYSPGSSDPIAYIDPQTHAKRNWPPEHGGGTVDGDPLITLRKATTDAWNAPFARLELAQDVTIPAVFEKAVAMGIPHDAPDFAKVASLTLGTAEASPLTMATVYGVLADGGVRHDPVLVSAVQDAKGGVVWRPDQGGEQVLSAKTADQITDILHGTLTNGTAAGTAQVRALGARGLAGMAGTNDLGHAAWFDGYSSNLVTAVDLTNTGADGKPAPLIRGKGGATVSGGTAVAPLWAQFTAQFEH